MNITQLVYELQRARCNRKGPKKNECHNHKL